MSERRALPRGWVLIACAACQHLGFSHENDSECVECGCERWQDLDFAVDFWPIDLGNGMRAKLMQSGDLLTSHRSDTGDPCGGYVQLSGRQPTHEVISAEPLTISPNVTCQTCHVSGFIKEGRWIRL